MLKNMEYVYAVYQKKSFSKAAESLHVSQPALSTAIRKIESELQLQLFDRSSSPINLTPAGRYYIESIEKIMRVEADMREYFARLAREQRTVINVGTASFFCSYVLPELAEEFKREHPEVAINLMEANSSEFAGLFASDVLDLCVSVDELNAGAGKAGLDSRVWKREEIILAVPAEYPIVEELKEYRMTFDQVGSGEYLEKKIPGVPLARFQEVPFLFLKNGNDLNRRAEQMCRTAGFEPHVAMYLDQMLTSYYVACSGKGSAFIRPDLVRFVEPTSRLYFFRLEDPMVTRDVMLYYPQNGLSPIAREFVDFLTDVGNRGGNE
jgi:DNA-binding transcriptional LysR family regulator